MGSTAMEAGRNSPRGRYKSFEATDVAGIGLSFPSPPSFRGLSGGSCTGHRGLATASGVTGGAGGAHVRLSTFQPRTNFQEIQPSPGAPLCYTQRQLGP